MYNLWGGAPEIHVLVKEAKLYMLQSECRTEVLLIRHQIYVYSNKLIWVYNTDRSIWPSSLCNQYFQLLYISQVAICSVLSFLSRIYPYLIQRKEKLSDRNSLYSLPTDLHRYMFSSPSDDSGANPFSQTTDPLSSETAHYLLSLEAISFPFSLYI